MATGRLGRKARGGAVAVAVVAAGCGGLSHSEYVAKANRICAQANATPIPKSRTIADVARSGKLVVAADRREASQLRALEVPAKDRASFSEFLRLVDEQTALAEQEASAARRNDMRRLRAVDPRLSSKAAETSAAGAKAGLKSCAE